MKTSLTIQLKNDLLNTEQALFELTKIYNKLPIVDSIKKPFIKQALIEKSAWYACIINSNIDILLLPEYLENGQTRNILLKKETEQYIASIQQFDDIKAQSTQEIYETILFLKNEQEIQQSFNLFSSQIQKTENCPEQLINLFSKWNGDNLSDSLEDMVFKLIDWHSLNHNNFNNQRQIILWFNLQLWKKFGSISSRLNLEHYFYHNWNKVNREPHLFIKEFNEFLKAEVSKSKNALNQLFRANIQYETLKTPEKIAANYLFNNGFETVLNKDYQNNVSLNKTLLKKGFISFTDLSVIGDLEKFKTTIETLYNEEKIELVYANNEISLAIKTNGSQKSKLSDYNYSNKNLQKESINAFFNQKRQFLKSTAIEFIPEQTFVSQKAVTQKAYFG